MTKSNLRGAGVDVKSHADFNTRKSSAQASEKRTDPAPLAKGGKDAAHRMFEEQQASPAKGGMTSHNDIPGPGEQFAEGGDHPTDFAPALPAVAGRTAQPKGGLEPAGYAAIRRQHQASDRVGSNDAPPAKPVRQERPANWFKGE